MQTLLSIGHTLLWIHHGSQHFSSQSCLLYMEASGRDELVKLILDEA